MNAKQVSSLIATVEEDHRLLSVQLGNLRRVAEWIANIDASQREQGLELLQRIDHFFHTELLPHLAQEERELFPIIREQVPGGAGQVAELEMDHGEVRQQLESFRSQLAVLRYVDDPAQLFRLATTCWALWNALQVHAEKESRLVRQYVLAQMKAQLGQ